MMADMKDGLKYFQPNPVEAPNETRTIPLPDKYDWQTLKPHTVTVRVNELHTWQRDRSQVSPASAFACKHERSCRHPLPIVTHRKPAWPLSIRIQSWLLSSLGETSTRWTNQLCAGSRKRQRWCVYCFLLLLPTHGQDKIKTQASKRWGPMNCNSPFHSDTRRKQRIAKMRVPHHTCVSQPHTGLLTPRLSNCSFGTTNPVFFLAASSSFLRLPFPSIRESAFKVSYQEKLWQHSQRV